MSGSQAWNFLPCQGSVCAHAHILLQVVSAKVEKMLAAQGYQHGQGLGKQGQGIVEPVQAGMQQNRAGLGFGGATAPAIYDLLPDASWSRHRHFTEAPDLRAWTGYCPSPFEMSVSWMNVDYENKEFELPEDVLNSRIISSELFLELKSTRRAAAAALRARRQQHPEKRGLCPHHGARDSSLDCHMSTIYFHHYFHGWA